MNLLPLVVRKGVPIPRRNQPAAALSQPLPCASLRFLLAEKDLGSAGRVLRERTGSQLWADRAPPRAHVSVGDSGARGHAGSQGGWKGPRVCVPPGHFLSLLRGGRGSCSMVGRFGVRATSSECPRAGRPPGTGTGVRSPDFSVARPAATHRVKTASRSLDPLSPHYLG